MIANGFVVRFTDWEIEQLKIDGTEAEEKYEEVVGNKITNL